MWMSSKNAKVGRISRLCAGSALAVLFGLGVVIGCASEEEDDATSQELALAACGLNDGSVEKGAKLHACEPGNTKKTTICHVPPGNPANAHTLCIGNAAVPAHLRNHPDYLGECKNETPCPPPPGMGGAGGTTGMGGTGPAPGGNGGAAGMAGAGGASGAGGSVVIE
jgi:hypothetical protein